MLRIEISGLDRLNRDLARMRVRLGPSLAAGINRTAEAIEQHEMVAMESQIDRPRPFSLSGVRIYRAQASRRSPSAIITMGRIQQRYLGITVYGETLPTIIEPRTVRLDQHGNIPGKRGGLQGIARKYRGRAGSARFVAEIRGRLGVWERTDDQGRRRPTGRGLRMVAEVMRTRRREPRYRWFETAARVAMDRLLRDIRSAMVRMLR